MAEQIESKDRTQTIQQARSYYCSYAMSDQYKSHFQLSQLVYIYNAAQKYKPLLYSDSKLNLCFFPRYRQYYTVHATAAVASQNNLQVRCK